MLAASARVGSLSGVARAGLRRGRAALQAGRRQHSASAKDGAVPAPASASTAPTSATPANVPGVNPPASASGAALAPDAAAAAATGPDGRSDWWYAGWATLFSVVLGGPLFFLYELRTNIETRLWAQEHAPELIAELGKYYDVFGEAAPTEPQLAAALPALGMLFGSTSDEDCFDDGLDGTTAPMLEAALSGGNADREHGDEPVAIHVALTDGTHVVVTGRATDSDAAVMRAAVFAAGGTAKPGVSVDWLLTESEVTDPPSVTFSHPVEVVTPSAEQLAELEAAVEEEAARLGDLREASRRPDSLSPVERARLPQRLEELEESVASGFAAVAGLRKQVRV